jgi:hypothetical protein
MASSDATTVEAYLASLPEDRRAALTAVRQVILENLPEGYQEAMGWGMITYCVPLSVQPDTYNGQPLGYVALASQKNYMSLYLMAIYGSDAARRDFEAAYRATGKRFDAGKSCVRFRKLEDLPLDLVGRTVASIPMAEYVRRVDAAQSMRQQRDA